MGRTGRKVEVNTVEQFADTLQPIFAEHDIPEPADVGPNFYRWGSQDEGYIALLRVGTSGELEFDPHWRSAEGWDRYFAPKRYVYMPRAVEALRLFLAEPNEETARKIHGMSR